MLVFFNEFEILSTSTVSRVLYELGWSQKKISTEKGAHITYRANHNINRLHKKLEKEMKQPVQSGEKQNRIGEPNRCWMQMREH